MAKFVIVILALFLMVNVYLFIRTAQALSLHTMGKIILGTIFFLLSFAYIVAHLFKTQLPFSGIVVMETIGSLWIFILLYGLMAAILIDLIRIANAIFHFSPSFFSVRVQDVKLIVFYTVIIIIATLIGIGYYRFLHPKVQHLSIALAKSDYTEKRIRIVVVSDLHLGYILRTHSLDRFVNLINSQQPHIVLMVGDIVDNDVKALEQQQMSDHLQQIKAPLGVFACTGNHEYISKADAACAYLEKSGITVLRDTFVLLDSLFYLVGREDVSSGKGMKLEQIISSLNRKYPIVVLDHQPFRLEESIQNRVCLHLSGHTHGGQFFPVNLFTQKMFKIDHGYLRKEKTHIYVSSGLGAWGPAIRLGSSSEIVVIDCDI
jgi:predicted MPP superfamily phosphohydrolase